MLQRHSHHHHKAGLPYSELESLPFAPQLPASYPVMFLFSMVPPLYFQVMNPRVEAVLQAVNHNGSRGPDGSGHAALG